MDFFTKICFAMFKVKVTHLIVIICQFMTPILKANITRRLLIFSNTQNFINTIILCNVLFAYHTNLLFTS